MTVIAEVTCGVSGKSNKKEPAEESICMNVLVLFTLSE